MSTEDETESKRKEKDKNNNKKTKNGKLKADLLGFYFRWQRVSTTILEGITVVDILS